MKLKAILRKADEGRYAIPAFNYSDIWDFLAIIEAAEEEKSPVIISSNPLVVKAFGVDLLAVMGKTACRTAHVPLIHHLDHSTKYRLCIECIEKGYPSIMIDGSTLDFTDNIAITKKVVKYAHTKGVCVEGELGRIKGKGIEGEYFGKDFLVDVEEAVLFVEETKVDTLAVGLGTAHGFYKTKPQIDFKLLKEVNEAVDVPLVLHGGTGIPEENIMNAISLGINKVNIGTIIHCTYMNNLKKELNARNNNPYTLDVMFAVKDEIKKVVRKMIKICGSNGKA